MSIRLINFELKYSGISFLRALDIKIDKSIFVFALFYSSEVIERAHQG